MRAFRKYVLVTVSSKVSASLSSSTTRGLTGCTSHFHFSLGRMLFGTALGSDRTMLTHELTEGADAVATGAPGAGLPGDVGHAAGAVGDRLEDVPVGHHVAVAHVHGTRLTGRANRASPRGSTLGT